MAGYPNFSSTPVQNLVGQVSNPVASATPDGALVNVSLDKYNGLLVRQVGGAYSALANRISGGNVFMSNTLVAGVAIPTPATTLASKAGMINPLGSGVNVELIGIGLNAALIEVALKNYALEFQLAASNNGGAATSVTKLTANPLPLGNGKGTAAAYAYTAATMTNAAANTIVLPLFGNYLTAVGFIPTLFSFTDMPIVFGPDTVMAITVVGTAITTQVVYFWAEYPSGQ